MMKDPNVSDQLSNPVVQRESHGPCNICKSVGKLTWDHVPPQGSIQIKPMQQQTILQKLATGHGGDHEYSISQNGVKFRTLCGQCNNKLLGKRYDPVLKEFTASLTCNVTSGLSLPPVVHIETRPAHLVRAVFGHLLATKGKIQDTVPDQQMRSFFLDDNVTVPDGLKVFYWLHPYHNVVIIRDVAMPAVRGGVGRVCWKFGFFSILKFFPVGFLVSDVDEYEGLNELTQYIQGAPHKPARVPIKLVRVEDPRWPEIVDDGNLLAGGQSIQSSILATPKDG